MMFTSKRNFSISAACGVALGLLAFSGIAAAQDQGHYDQPPNDQGRYDQPPNDQGRYDQGRYDQGRDDRGRYEQGRYEQQGRPEQDRNDQGRNAPAHLRINAGTYVTVRVNQWLSSDRNKQGEPFAATLAQSIIVDGVVVAQKGQTVGGRITEAQKAGRVQGTSRLGLEVIDLTLADGQVVPVQSEMISRDGRTSVGRDVAGVAGATALGAIIGGGAGNGAGAAIGAGAGAAAGVVGVLLTRGQPTVVYPEAVMTFRVSAPVEISTERAPQAFRYADSYDYERAAPEPGRRPQVAYGPPPPPYGPYYDPYFYSPYYRPGFSVYVGPGRYRGGYYYYRGRR